MDRMKRQQNRKKIVTYRKDRREPRLDKEGERKKEKERE